jgi:tRNA acetyltransferase TAN1
MAHWFADRVDFMKMLCGMSVVDGKEWESFKRYNLNEMYKLAREEKHEQKQEATAKGEVEGEKKDVDAEEGNKKNA